MLAHARRAAGSAAALSLFLSMLVASPLAAQQRGPSLEEVRARLAEMPAAALTGNVVAVQRGGIRLKTASGETHDVQVIEQLTVVYVTGTATRDFLKAGLFVRFTAEKIDRKGTASGAITEVALFTPTETVQPGVATDSEDNMGPWYVAGQIKSITKRGRAVVVAGEDTVKVDIPEDATIVLETADYSIVQEGDAISVVGRTVKLPMGDEDIGQNVAEQVEVTLAKPATGGKKPRKPRQTAEKPAEEKPANGAANE